MMKAKAGIANALITANDNRAKYSIHNKTLQLAKYSICGGKAYFKQERPDLHQTLELNTGRGSASNGRDPNPSVPAASNRRAGTMHNTQYEICNKARKIILEQGYCTDIYNKKRHSYI